jgi:hypothetical protein
MKMSYNDLLAPGLIDSALKLQILLLFSRNPGLCGEMWSLSEWLREAPWDVEAALAALATVGVLVPIADGEHFQYRLDLGLEHLVLLERLVTAFDDPQQRDQIHTLIRAADQERRFRAWLVAEEDRTEKYELVV